MKKIISKLIIINMIVFGISTGVTAKDVDIKSYGHYKKMIHKKKTAGIVNLKKAISLDNSYAVGAIQKGLGEITVINGDVWLDYGKDGIGNSKNTIPSNEKAVLLATTQVKKWKVYEVRALLPQEELFKFILDKAKEHGLNVNKPFPFLLEGNFDKLKIHVISGQNPKFGGHGGKTKLFHQVTEERTDQKATVVGFYSAKTQGVYTHPGESWHLHAVIKDENIGAHIDGISSTESVILKLPL